MNYRPEIDGLRALAVLAVYLFHLNPEWLPGGFAGVDVFFVLSGYLITSIILKDLEKSDFSIARFYQRRIARILPAFLVMATVTLIGAKMIYSAQDFSSAGNHFTGAILSITNLKFMMQGNYFEMSPDAHPFLHCWSLSVEEQFYLIFPLLLAGLFKFSRQSIPRWLLIANAVSFVACVCLTFYRPGWAFYLLPTRAWELGMGCWLAVVTKGSPVKSQSLIRHAGGVGLIIVISSFWLLREGPSFPGFSAALPVIGTLGILMTGGAANSSINRFLSLKPLVAIGKISYSLYIWHWPVFSLVDYQYYIAPEWQRVLLKVTISIFFALVSYWMVETPARRTLNKPAFRKMAFVGTAVIAAAAIPLGLGIRRDNYVNASAKEMTTGGLVYGSGKSSYSVILIGDSHGSMYGKALREICEKSGSKLTILSSAGADPLPKPDRSKNPIWEGALGTVKSEKPDCVIIAAAWATRLENDRTLLDEAIALLRPHAKKISLLNQPPALPKGISRKSIRDGALPPFHENEKSREKRISVNAHLRSLENDFVTVIDVAKNFESASGEIRFLDEKGHQLYHDTSHLSGFGASFVSHQLESAIMATRNQ